MPSVPAPLSPEHRALAGDRQRRAGGDLLEREGLRCLPAAAPAGSWPVAGIQEIQSAPSLREEGWWEKSGLAGEEHLRHRRSPHPQRL